MPSRRAHFTAISGPNEGDTIRIELGTCRLVGRHLSDNETALLGRDGNRIIDGPAAEIITSQLKERSPSVGMNPGPERFSADAFERGPDVVLSDDSISRAHAMVFFDHSGVGIIDLASTNGTLINHEPVASAMVSDGDTVTLGGSDLVVKIR